MNRFRAFERLLSEHPEFLGRVMLFQVAVPSRTDVKEYQELKETLDKLVGQINGRFSTASWSPIRYIYGCIAQSDLAGFYRDADVALVTPLRSRASTLNNTYTKNDEHSILTGPFGTTLTGIEGKLTQFSVGTA